ncbi:MAG TPA: HlyD family secretion protein [Myxococcales bacterium]|jgi:membrane fusion protein (multidrug efflux system)|nr:HlyD family secretion protein [Myxococcales bacterium]
MAESTEVADERRVRADVPQRDGRGPPEAAEEKASEAGKKRSLRLRVGLGILVVALAGFGWWLYARQFEETDDAQIDGDISAVSPRVPGTVTAVHVIDNQEVKQGDLMVELDPTDLEVAVAQARAAVAQAEAAYQSENPTVAITQTSNRASLSAAEDDVQNARAELLAARHDLDQAEAQDRLAQLQLQRGKRLLESNTISQADFDQRQSAADVTRANVEAARQRIAQKQAKLDTAETRLRETRQNAPRQLVSREASLQARKANLELAQAQLKQAELNLGYSRITAPASGVLGKKSVNVGERVQPGQQLVPLTQTGRLWVTANFRETQIQLMRPGQKASVHVDAINRDYGGAVASFAGATGSRYSLLPPENASGNYVKVVQRIPVRITIDPGQPELERLRPGMSVEPKVRVR